MPKETSTFDRGISVCATYHHQVAQRKRNSRLRACKALLFAGRFDADFTPCVVTAVTGEYGGVVAGLGSMLSTKLLEDPTIIYFELYRGAQASTKC